MRVPPRTKLPRPRRVSRAQQAWACSIAFGWGLHSAVHFCAVSRAAHCCLGLPSNAAPIPLTVVNKSLGRRFCWQDEGTQCVELEDGTPRCDCNTHWALGATYTGATCETPTVDCGHGVWCVDNGSSCATRASAWAHGDGEKACKDAGGVCVDDQRHVARSGLYFCRGGQLDGVACNAATSCRCLEGFTGAHCEHEVVVCARSSFGTIKHYCMAASSEGCRGEKECDCVDGFRGRHCEVATSGWLPDEVADGQGKDGALSGGLLALVVLALLVAVAAAVFAVFMVRREKQGSPLFKPLLEMEDGEAADASAVELNGMELRPSDARQHWAEASGHTKSAIVPVPDEEAAGGGEL